MICFNLFPFYKRERTETLLFWLHVSTWIIPDWKEAQYLPGNFNTRPAQSLNIWTAVSGGLWRGTERLKKKKSFFSFLWPCYITHGILIPQPETKSLWKYGILTTGPLQKSPRALSSDPWVWIQAQSFTITGCQGKSQCSDLLRGHHCIPLIEYSVRSKWKTLTEQPGCGLVERTQAPGKWCILASLWLAYYYLLQDDYWLSALSSSHSLNTC